MTVTLSPDVMTKLDQAVEECIRSLAMIQAQKDFQKDVIDRLKEEIDGFSASDFNNLVKERYSEKTSDKIAKLQSVIDLNDALIENRRKNKKASFPPTGGVSEEAEDE